MHTGVVPGDGDGSGRMPLHERLQQFGDLSTAFMQPEADHRFARVLVHRPDPVVLVGLAWGRNHHLLPFRAPHGAPGGEPAQMKRIRIIEHFAWFQAITGRFNRLFFPRYSGSGLVIVCWGRLSTISPDFSHVAHRFVGRPNAGLLRKTNRPTEASVHRE